MTVKLIICEGARGTGKSTVTRALRNKLHSATLINFTGFRDDGDVGLAKISAYYDAWLTALESMASVEGGENTYIVCDRFFMSEWVYSALYKTYNFSEKYDELLERMSKLDMEMYYFYFELPKDSVLEERLIRDKVPFATAPETIRASKQQDRLYRAVADIIKETPFVLQVAVDSDNPVEYLTDVIMNIVE